MPGASVRPPWLQLTDQGVFDSCKEKQLCVLSFLPHILDSGESRFHCRLRDVCVLCTMKC